MAKITYNDKSFLNQNVSIADENKVNDTDINELKYGTNDILDLLGLSTNTYNSSTNYAVGNRVIYNNQIYECIAATTGSWDSSKWSLVPLFDNQNINFNLIPDVYSTDEIKTNKVWRNGKPIYRKVVNMGTLNNATSKTFAHGISNIDEFTFVYGEANNGYTWVKDAGFNDELYWSKTSFTWNTKTNRTAFTAFITAEYTKTTD